MYVYVLCVPGAQNPEENVRHPGNGVTEDCDSPCDSWELNLCPSCLTVEPSQWPGMSIFKKKGTRT